MEEILDGIKDSVRARKKYVDDGGGDKGPHFDHMSSFFPCEIDNAVQ